MIFEQNEKELLLKLITYEQSRLTIQKDDEDVKDKTDNIIEKYTMIKKKIKRL